MPKAKQPRAPAPAKASRGVKPVPYNTEKALEYGADNAHRHISQADQKGAAADRLTTNQGVPISDNQSSLKVGLRRPALLEDFVLREKITHFDHERIPERVVHARGSAAHGVFTAYDALTQYTWAAPFAEADKSMENAPSVLFDALVLPDGAAAVNALAQDGLTLEYIKEQFRHCKPILVLGESSVLFERAGIPLGNSNTAGILWAKQDQAGAVASAFIQAIAAHRHTERDSDPPVI